MPVKVGLAAAAALLLLLAPATADDFVGFEARYIPHVEYDGKPVETEGYLTIAVQQICDSFHYMWNSTQTVTLPDRVEENQNSGVWHEKLDGTGGTVHYFVQDGTLVDGQIVRVYIDNFFGEFERAAPNWQGTIELTRQSGDIEILYKMPLYEDVLTPGLAYKSMLDRLAAGETSFTQPVSIVGMLDSLDPAYATKAQVTVETVESPFANLELPQTPDGMFGERFWVVSVSNLSLYADDGVKTLTYQLFENGLRGYILSESKHFRVLFEPVTAHAVLPEPC